MSATGTVKEGKDYGEILFARPKPERGLRQTRLFVASPDDSARRNAKHEGG